MRYLAAAIVLVLIPQIAVAVCSLEGYTVVYVNGILSPKDSADLQVLRLIDEFDLRSNTSGAKVIGGHNESHLLGVGDLVQSTTQAFNNPLSDYDLKTILMQIHPQVTTRKILLVGHSQGTFYTNELYKYLTSHGVPAESVGVYNLATPASYVAGGGSYLTSSNDKLINMVRNLQTTGNAALNFKAVAPALEANIAVPQEAGYAGSTFAGHGLTVYLDGAGERIIGEIDAALNKLRANGSVAGSEGGCFESPEANLGYRAKGAAYAIADTFSQGSVAIVGTMHSTTVAFTDYVIEGYRNLGHFAQMLFSAPTTVVANTQGASAVLATPLISSALLPTGVAPQNVQPPQQNLSETPSAPENVSAVPAIQPRSPDPTVQIPMPPATVPQSAFAQLVPVQPGFGGGGVANQSTQQSAESTAATPILLEIVEPADNSVYATSSIAAHGTSAAHALITAELDAAVATTSADALGNWSLTLTLTEGTSIASFVAFDVAGDPLAAITRTLTLDTTAPATTTLTIQECAKSIVADMCIVPEAAVSLTWVAVADATTYAIEKDGVSIATTSALQFGATIDTGATTTFAVLAYDAADNAARSTAREIFAVEHPLIINEIGWGGDGVDASRQWIELKNTTPYVIDLSNFSIHRSGGEPITLSGSVSNVTAQNYLSVQPSSIPGISIPEFIAPFSLATANAEEISLTWNDVVVDATPPVSACPTWCAGAAAQEIGSNTSGFGPLIAPLSMERVSDAADGALPASWRDTDGYGGTTYVKSGLLSGTPGMENTYGYPESGVLCDQNSRTVVQANQALDFDIGCVFLTLFIAGDPSPYRNASLYRGVVGSSTIVTGTSASRDRDIFILMTMPADAQPGEQFFFAINELRHTSWGTMQDYEAYRSYYTDGSAAAPPTLHTVIPFVYQPQ